MKLDLRRRGSVVRTRVRQLPAELKARGALIRGLARERSLLRVVSRQRNSLAITPTWVRRRREAADFLTRLIRDELAFLWVLPLAVGLAFVNWHVHFRPFGSPARGTSYLYAVWGVQAVTLTLSLAVVIFVFQAVYASRFGGSLRRFAEETGLFLMFYIGLAGLFVDGIVLLGGGHGASGGWAATWATCLAALQGLSLIYLFVSTIRAIDPGSLHNRRLRHARLEIRRATERVILRRLALNFLRDFSARCGIDYVPFFTTRPSATARAVVPGRAGEVKDLRLWILRWVGWKARRKSLPSPRLRASLGDSVGDKTELLWAEPAALPRWPRWGFKILARDREQGFLTTVEELHTEAMQAIRALTPTGYSDVTEFYEEMLLALPETWAQYGQSFGPAVAGEATPFELGFLDYLERNLYLEMELAVDGPSREIAQEALNFPIRIATRALPLRATALTGRMLRLWVAGVVLLVRSELPASQRPLVEWSRLRISEYGRLSVEPLLTDDEGDWETREFARDVLLQVIDAIASVCTALLDQDPAQTQLIGEFNGILDEFLQHWQPEHDAPQQWDIEIAENAGATEEELADLRLRFEDNRRKLDLKEQIDDWRAVQRFGLLFWILRHVRDGSDGAWSSAWTVFANYFGDVPRLASITELAVKADFEDRGRWSSWVLDTLPKGQVHGLAVDLEFIQTFVVRALDLVPPDGPAPDIEPMEWARGRLDDPADTVRGIAGQERLKPLLPDERLDERVDVLIEALNGANERRQELEDLRVIEAALDDEKVASFERVFRESFWPERWLRAAMVAAGALESVAGNPPDDAAGSYVSDWMSKGMFIEDATILGADMSANQLGLNLASHENSLLVPELRQSPRVAAAEGESIAQTVRRAIQELRDDGRNPTLILMPFNWQLYGALAPALSEARGGDAPVPDWFPGDSRAVYLGLVEDVPVCQIHRLQEEEIYVADLVEFVRWREWTRGADGLEYELRAFTLAEAEQMVAENPGDGGEEPEVLVRRTRMSVRLRAGVARKQNILDQDAARVIEIPEALRRG